MTSDIAVLRLADILLVSVPPDPDDDTVAGLQMQLLRAMETSDARGLVLDMSTVEIIDSYFARTISETIQMVTLMGGVTVISGISAAASITTTQLGLRIGAAATALDVNRALTKLRELIGDGHEG
jgi:rsbT antagonist protein RsbS